jgi:hypothetical protein
LKLQRKELQSRIFGDDKVKIVFLKELKELLPGKCLEFRAF